MNIFLWILFGRLAGWLASLIAGRGTEMGVLANIVVGIAGAFRWLDCGPSRFWRKTGCRSPVAFTEQRRPMSRHASAFRIARTSQSCSPDHLLHFTLHASFPRSPVGRHSHDYYWSSVTLALTGRRPSRVPSRRNVSSAT
jgi:hypothetical protein